MCACGICLHDWQCICVSVSEESSLVDIFIFGILVTYVESLSLAHSDDKVFGQFTTLFQFS